MNIRERFNAVLEFKPFDRLPIIEWASWWKATIERWQQEGLPSDLGGPALCRYFNMDVHYQDWLESRAPECPRPLVHGGPTIKSIDDYLAIKPYLYSGQSFNSEKWKRWAEEQKQGDVILWFTLDGFFWFPRTLLGIEPHLYSFYDNPELMHMINQDNADYHIQMIDRICSFCKPDFMTFAEDMSYNRGPMISRELFKEFIKPYYEKVIPRLKDHGIKVIIDSDGDISIPSYWFEEAGIDGILPLERQAGCDVNELRKQHPHQIYIGAFDKMVMDKGENAMRNEFERLLPIARKGGFIISCDHQTPPGVSLGNYKLYLKLFREYAEKAAK